MESQVFRPSCSPATFILGLLLLVTWGLLVVGCNAPDGNGLGKTDGDVQASFSLENESKQVVTTIPYQDLKSWIEKNKTIRIWSICPVDRGGHGWTNAFVIVYEKTCDHACPVCGQQMPAEKQ